MMTTEAKMVAMLVDAIAEDENGVFGPVGESTMTEGGPYRDFAELRVWAADGTAFQIVITREREHDIKISFEQELNNRAYNLAKEINSGRDIGNSTTMLEGIQIGYARALEVYRLKRDLNILEGESDD